MADISIQFHGLQEELLLFVRRCMEISDLRVVAISQFPFRAQEVFVKDLHEVFSDLSTVRELAFSLKAPVLNVEDELEFGGKNSGCLYLAIGRENSRGLNESWLACRTKNAKSLKVWKQLAKILKKMTEKGAIATNPKTGARAKIASHRFTRGAKELELKGVPILPVAGTALLQLGDESSEKSAGND